jgi:hypothetical protein
LRKPRIIICDYSPYLSLLALKFLSISIADNVLLYCLYSYIIPLKKPAHDKLVFPNVNLYPLPYAIANPVAELFTNTPFT